MKHVTVLPFYADGVPFPFLAVCAGCRRTLAEGHCPGCPTQPKPEPISMKPLHRRYARADADYSAIARANADYSACDDVDTEITTLLEQLPNDARKRVAAIVLSYFPQSPTSPVPKEENV